MRILAFAHREGGWTYRVYRLDIRIRTTSERVECGKALLVIVIFKGGD